MVGDAGHGAGYIRFTGHRAANSTARQPVRARQRECSVCGQSYDTGVGSGGQHHCKAGHRTPEKAGNRRPCGVHVQRLAGDDGQRCGTYLRQRRREISEDGVDRRLYPRADGQQHYVRTGAAGHDRERVGGQTRVQRRQGQLRGQRTDLQPQDAERLYPPCGDRARRGVRGGRRKTT